MLKSNVIKLTKEESVKYHMEEIQNTIDEYVQFKKQIVLKIFPNKIKNQIKNELIKEVDDNVLEKETLKKIYEIVSSEGMDIANKDVKGLVEYMLKEKSKKWMNNILKNSYKKNNNHLQLINKNKLTIPPKRKSKQTIISK